MMQVIYNGILFLRLIAIVSIILLVLPSVRTERTIKRSARWDAHLQHIIRHRQRRDTQCNPQLWQSEENPKSSICRLTNLLQNDTLGRRASNKLYQPQSQGRCGSCWAFAATHAYTDHLRLSGNSDLQLAPQYPVACFNNRHYVTGGNGCCGAAVHAGLEFFRINGAVTEQCAPYTLQSYINTTNEKLVPISNYCPSSCKDSSPFRPNFRRLYSYTELNSDDDIMSALQQGPVIAAMYAITSFKNTYRCGIYCSTQNEFSRINGHAVEIVDYGTTTEGVNFWVVKNSWGSTWGENGYFRIIRGDPIMSGFNQYFAPVIKSNANNNPSYTIVSVCGAGEVKNVTASVLVMAAIDHVIEEFNKSPPILCWDNRTNADYYTLASNSKMKNNATEQVVAGAIVTLELVLDVKDCLCCNIKTTAMVNATVFVDLDNFFNLTSYSYTRSGSMQNSINNAVGLNEYILLIIGLIVFLLFGI